MNEQAYLSITRQSQLDDYCQEILANSKITWIAIDTEFVRVDTYFPELSLVQIQDGLGNAVIIDPLAIIESSTSAKPLHALVELLANEHLLKVFHSARQDIEVLYLIENKMPANIFDTQIAAIFQKHGDLAGFARVIEAELGHKLEKSQTRTNWHARPLTEKQIAYALDDVRYLAPLYQKYIDKLPSEQLEAIKQDCSLMLDESLYKPNPETAGSKIKNLKGLRAKGTAIVNSLAKWREEYAIQNNQPKKWVMSDDVITSIAKRPPKTVQALYKVPNIKSSSVKEFGEIWISLIDEIFANDIQPSSKAQPKAEKATQQEELLISYLSSYVQQVALQYKLVGSHIINKTQLLQIIREPSQEQLSGWRNILVGQDLNKLLAGEAKLTIENNQIKLLS